MSKPSAKVSLNPQQLVGVGLALAVALICLVVVAAVSMHTADAQFITSDELQRNVQELQSYTSEAQIISTYSQQKSALRSYTESYSSSLQKAVDSVSEKLSEHAHADNLTPKVNKTIQIADLLSARLEDQVQEPTNQFPSQAESDHFFNDMAKNLQAVEAGL